ncbi:hypothetical protein LPB140_10755 [Sphingorhabdus lutea]|uniref:DUF3800 domain-containing protein n=1 Tax=Sphingorhabdus lutea TaxID=1913578 RepID=A0A1L3JDK6_9SPHN|nr:DUF3800 domain-containing protein [Sphingorhabdus lutea]APG63189.1 hypothetical protein LPB140_10755 [Sphingorhabdus lutea]
MPIYCDESGGLGTGYMSFAAIYISADDAAQVQARYRGITGLSGELKGSRIDLTERGLIIEILSQKSVNIAVSYAAKAEIGDMDDKKAYSMLLEQAVGDLLPLTGGCGDVIIDDGRYDPMILSGIKGEIADLLGNWGKAILEDSKNSDGIQLADILANSVYNMLRDEKRRSRIKTILQPLIETSRCHINKLRLNQS